MSPDNPFKEDMIRIQQLEKSYAMRSQNEPLTMQISEKEES